MLRVLCCGSRKWNNPQLVYEVLAELPSDATIIHGNETGADTFVKEAAIRLGLHRMEFATQGAPAPAPDPDRPTRAIAMLNEKPDLVIAFHQNLDQSKGTVQILKEAKIRHIAIQLVS